MALKKKTVPGRGVNTTRMAKMTIMKKTTTLSSQTLDKTSGRLVMNALDVCPGLRDDTMKL